MPAWARALARALARERTLEAAQFATVAELAERQEIAPSCMTRVLRLTLLAPVIVEAILDGRQESGVTLARVLEYPSSSSGGRSPFTFVSQQGVGEDE